jgi:hypothetical protein
MKKNKEIIKKQLEGKLFNMLYPLEEYCYYVYFQFYEDEPDKPRLFQAIYTGELKEFEGTTNYVIDNHFREYVENRMIYFISGHRDIKKDEFYKWYVPELEKVLKNDLTATFVVGDYWGADKKAQDWLNKNLEDKSIVTVYHMFSEPRNLVSKN